jgi:DNA-binding transcriptional MerR regulator
MAKQHRSTASGDPHPSVTPEATMPANPDQFLRIEQVAARTGLTRRTLRYYEERGLLDPPTRTEGNYRLYSEADVDHIMRVKRIRELLGASLAEVREMVEGEEARQAFRDEWARNPDPDARVALLDRGEAVVARQLEVVRARMADLRELESALVHKQDRYRMRRDEMREQIARNAASPHADAVAEEQSSHVSSSAQ